MGWVWSLRERGGNGIAPFSCTSKQLLAGYNSVSADGVAFELEMKARAPCNRLLHLLGPPSSSPGYRAAEHPYVPGVFPLLWPVLSTP